MNEERLKIILQYLTGTLDTEKLNEFEKWLGESDSNRAAFEEIKTAWILTRAETNYKTQGQKSVWKNILKKTDALNQEYKKERRKVFLQYLSRAAVLLIAIAIGGLVTFFTYTNTNLMHTGLTRNAIAPIHADTILIEANKGSRSEIVLPDGSKVWLNSGSQLKMLPDFYNGKRMVHLTGEAYFDIKKKINGNLFRVKTSDIQIKVLGTEFNLKSYPEEGTIETTLEEGSVVIEKELNTETVEIATLAPNEKAIFVKKKGEITIDNMEVIDDDPHSEYKDNLSRQESVFIKENVDTELYTSWKDGHLIFKDESFKNIVIKMERWYNVKIDIENPKLKDLHFTANFKNETIEQSLYALKLTHEFNYKHDIEENVITIK